jgi:hypothetical protein
MDRFIYMTFLSVIHILDNNKKYLDIDKKTLLS